MKLPIDLVGMKFGRLEVVSPAQQRPGQYSKKRTVWFCRCECGKTTTVLRDALIGGSTKSCGCLNNDMRKSVKHGMSKTRLYYVWNSMRSRCTKPNTTGYKYYGGRGISVCDRWMKSFESFIEDMGPRPPRTTLDRIDPDGNYEPSNCRWATWHEQAKNKRRPMLTRNGVTKPVIDWAREYGLKSQTVYQRIRQGRPPLSPIPHRPASRA